MANYEKPDHWSQKAAKEGYPARSVYKLQEIDEKFKLLPDKQAAANCKVLDLGAAPGSWSLYILKKFSGSGFLSACDLSVLSPKYGGSFFDGDNFFFIQADFFAEKTRKTIMEKGPFNLILCDAAPATSGSGSLDALRSLELAEGALSYAQASLVKGGNFCVKIFQGGGTADFIKKVRLHFDTVKTFKPQACRRESVETYIIGLRRQQFQIRNC